MKTFKSFVFGLLLAVAGVAGAAAFYVGFSPSTNLAGVPGVPVATGVMPVISGSGCGTLATVQASEVGGASVVQFTSNSTACTVTLTTATISPATSAAAAPNGLFCVAVDETHPADVGSQSAHTTTSCTIAFAATTSGDNILVEINGF